jgi:hypothetical protein
MMNQPFQQRDNEEDKCRELIAQTGSHRQLKGGDNGKGAGGNASGQQSQQRQAPAVSGGQVVTSGRSSPNMCRKLSDMASKTASAINPSPLSTPGTSHGARQVSAAQSSPGVASLPDVEERVDEDVQTARLEASKKQAQLERRIEFLQRRLRRVQSRQVEQHSRQQLLHFVDFQHQNLQTVSRTVTTPSAKSGSDLKKELLSDDCKNLSTAALVSLVQRMQKSQSLQPPTPAPPAVKSELASVVSMSDDVRRESKVAAEKLRLSLHFAHMAVDSDATESSSGGESCDEDVEGLPVPSTPL